MHSGWALHRIPFISGWEWGGTVGLHHGSSWNTAWGCHNECLKKKALLWYISQYVNTRKCYNYQGNVETINKINIYYFSDSKGNPRCITNSKGRKRKPGSKDLATAIRCNDTLFVDFISKCLEWVWHLNEIHSWKFPVLCLCCVCFFILYSEMFHLFPFVKWPWWFVMYVSMLW